MICILTILLCILDFEFRKLTEVVKLVLLQPHSCKHSSVKTAMHAFFKPLTSRINSCQPLNAHKNLDPAANRKSYT